MRLFALILATLCTCSDCSDIILPEIELTKLAFGSCNMHDRPQPMWSRIREQKPEIFVWLGDAIYGDTRVFPFVWRPSPLPVLKEKYRLQKSQPEYKKFVEDANVLVLGVWDDHDYNLNDGGRDYEDKKEVQQMFLDFVDEDRESIRRRRDGLYASYLIGPKERRVKLLLLDVRSQLDRRNGDVLGDDQWSWLETELVDDEGAALVVVGSGMPVLSDMSTIDSWNRYGESRQRLLRLLTKHPKTLLLSGDVHFAEASCLNATEGHPLYELTSSGLTHNCFISLLPESTCSFFLDYVLKQSRRISAKAYSDLNFGTVTIDWNKGKVRLSAHGVTDHLFRFSFPLFNKTANVCPPTTTAGKADADFYVLGATAVAAAVAGAIALAIAIRRTRAL
ncbi:uncharacterized protein [Oscarella lobularis]|uniref:uncharacterized protein isoform X2 n=1 Tax=Oscarella lobularis TaxID=121494 RepID=UPI00331436EA